MTMNSKMDRRVQFDLVPERLQEMEQLMVYCDLKTRRDLFDNAMTLFEWAVHEVRAGNEIASYDRSNNKVEVVRLPVLENAARKNRTHKFLTVVEPQRPQPAMEQVSLPTDTRQAVPG